MYTCNHCYKEFDDSHLCEVVGRAIDERSSKFDVSPVIPSRPEVLTAGVPRDILVETKDWI